MVAALLAAAMTTFDSTINRFARNDEEARHDNASVLATNRSEWFFVNLLRFDKRSSPNPFFLALYTSISFPIVFF